MSTLSHQQIEALINGPVPLVTGYVDLGAQLQPNGIDLTLQSIATFVGPGKLGKTNAERTLAQTQELALDADGSLHLDPGPYLVTFNEVVHLPHDVMALAKPRSSLLRSGAAIHHAVWDAGYEGRSQALLVVYSPHGMTLARDARLVQLVFLTLEAATVAPYAGQFQREHLRGTTP